MPLEIYLRGSTWWAKGRIEYNGKAITEYYRCSTGTSVEQAAWDWCTDEAALQIRRYLIGDEEAEGPLSFAGAVLLYNANPKTAEYLLPIVGVIGEQLVKNITPKMVRELGKQLYPNDGTVSWVRQVVTPVRSVINNAHDLGKCAPIKIKGYTKEEKLGQDKKRGSSGRQRYEPGSWEWLLKFCKHAERRVRALALTMFTTGARISQAITMHPKHHLDLQNCRICIPGAKGHDDRWLTIPTYLVVELANLPELFPRGWDRNDPENMRVFGYADRSSPRKEWNKAIKAAGIPFLPFHSAGRHGFGQEMNVRQPIDEKAAGEFGGWSDTGLMKRTYTHAEDTSEKVHKAFKKGLSAAERRTKIRLARSVG
jgi:integrase